MTRRSLLAPWRDALRDSDLDRTAIARLEAGGSEGPEPVTALQRAQTAFLVALETAQTDARTHRVFCDIATRRLASEYARHLEAA